jgi:PEGA domain
VKTIFKSIVILATATITLLAEEEATGGPMGFIRVVAAVAKGTGPTNVLFDGEDMRPKGYKLGDATGGIGLKPGSHKVTIKREGVKEGFTTVTLEKNQTVTLIPFAELVPATELVPQHHKVQILRLKQKNVESGRTATFVSVSANPELKAEVMGENGKWSTVFVKRLSISETPLNFSQAFAPVKVNGEKINPIPIGSDGNYVVVLYDDAEDKVQSLYFRDFKFLSAD